MAKVTALRVRGEMVVADLDGARWRTLPVTAVVETGLAVGVELDRERARVLARALRRHRAERVALQSLSRREQSHAALDTRLERAGVRATERREVLESASRAGLVDDARFATSRAQALAERGAGDLLVLDDLARHGVDTETAQQALSLLEPEAVRAGRIVAARGRSARTLRYLGSRGFAPESLDDLIAELENGALP